MAPPSKIRNPMKRGGLEDYRKKRDASRTSEPFGRIDPSLAGVFVVQKHAATRTHFDLRLEMDGVLKSWAVPKGPSVDPDEKRFAVQTEDHPIEYQDFEGVIPEGNYGAGAMIVWDKGLWVPIEGDKVGLEKGKLLFELRGYKLRGVWTMFRISKQEKGNEWLLVKKPDGWARDPEDAELPQHSVLSGLTVEELAAGGGRCAELVEELADRGVKERLVDAAEQRVMLAQPRETPFSKKGWIFELKYDGFRLLASKAAGRVRLFYRHGSEATHVFPEIARAIAALPVERATIDGEVVILDAESRPSFQRLQQRTQLRRSIDLQQASVRLPATFFGFDLLQLEDYDLRSLPLDDRKHFLEGVLPQAGPLRFCDHIHERGEDLFESVEAMGLEGIVAKKADSTYRPGRSSNWQKIRVDRSDEFAIVGYTLPKGSRTGFAALHLGHYRDSDEDRASGDDGRRFLYAGRVGTGFSQADLDSIHQELQQDIQAECPLEGPAPKGDRQVWVEPRLVCEVRFKELTDAGLLRHPSFLCLREDKGVGECIWLDDVQKEEREQALAAAEEMARSQRKVRLSNLTKVFWPEEGYTKGDLIGYYLSIAPWILPYLRNRPLVLTRYPDGINGKSFFQKNAPEFAPDWVRTETIWSEHSEREIQYFVCEDAESLEFIANLGAIVLHLWSSTLDSLSLPDWCILDLDPKEAPFVDVVKVARAVKRLCDDIELDCFVKTSGSTGLHVLLPLARQCNYEQSRLLAELIARVVAYENPDFATITRVIERREGKVYLDYGQNGHGRLLVAPFSVRPLPGAPVSAPLRWREVNSKLTLERFTIKSVPRRMKRLKDEPLLGVLQTKPDLGATLARLEERASESTPDAGR